MKTFLSFTRSRLAAFVALAAWALAGAAFAQPQAERQNLELLRKQAEQFLHIQTAGMPGQVKLAVGPIDPRTSLPACAAPEAFLPNGSRPWGRTTVGMRCNVPSPWTIYISATVRVMGSYLATATPLTQGRVLEAADVVALKGDLTALPNGIITDTSQAISKSLTISLRAGTPLRDDVLRSQQAVQQGQIVRLETKGSGFRVSAEARAINNAAAGQIAQARTASGQVVSGVAKAGGIVEVTY
jgi:flagella basal body P-ring formation protein FlgA